ncbi:MAG TPA: hypothetical protein VGD87_14420, partial [Archangium sp.]
MLAFFTHASTCEKSMVFRVSCEMASHTGVFGSRRDDRYSSIFSAMSAFEFMRPTLSSAPST